MKIKLCYFSPTGATRQVASQLTRMLADKLNAEVVYHSYTLPRERVTMPVFEDGDLVLWATPVYAGRIPNKTLDYVRSALGSIQSDEGLPLFEGICIKCQACRLSCPEHAIAFTDPDYHSHVSMIEHNFAAPKSSEFFIGDKATVPHMPLWHS